MVQHIWCLCRCISYVVSVNQIWTWTSKHAQLVLMSYLLITYLNRPYVNVINPHSALGFNIMAKHHMGKALLNDLSLVHFQSLFKVRVYKLVEHSSSENDVVTSHLFLLCPQPTRRTVWPTLILKQLFSYNKDGWQVCQSSNWFFFLICMEGKSIIVGRCPHNIL